jgi:dihydrofolate reductase
VRVVVSEFVTLDGVMEDPGGSEGMDGGGWAFQFDRGADGDKFKLDEVLASDALLLGRRTYDGFAAAWPSRTDDIGFAGKMNSMTKYVVSSTLDNPEWNNTHVVKGDVAHEIAELRRQPGRDLLVNGSAQLVKTLLENRLIDELRLMIFPVMLGRGKRLFPEGIDATQLRVVEVKQAADVVVLRLQPKEAAG